jgi:cell division septal protein FtsQ
MFFKNKNKNKIKVLHGEKKPWRRKKTSSSDFSLGRMFFYLLEIVFLGTIIYILFFSFYLSITSIEVVGTKKVDPEKIKVAIEEKISGKFLGIIPKNNLLFVYENNVKKYLLNKFKRIEDIKVKKIFPEKIIISVKEKQFQLIFSTGEQKYLIDENGSAWPRDDFELDDAEKESLITLMDESAKPIADAKMALSGDFIKYIMDVRDGIKNDAGIEISRNFYSPRLISGDLTVETKDGWKIYFNREIDLSKSIGILKSILGENIKKEYIPNLEYIDLRINNKVYYKFKNAEINTEEQNNSAVATEVPSPSVKPKETDRKKKD